VHGADPPTKNAQAALLVERNVADKTPFAAESLLEVAPENWFTPSVPPRRCSGVQFTPS
jgi:hypothetical protein